MHDFDTPVPESAEWEAWLEYADALTAAGDPRGEAIRLEHLCETGDGGGDAAALAAAYGRVERQLGLDGLRDDGSWRFTWSRGFIDEASFLLTEEAGPQRRALVERLLAGLPHAGSFDPADPEQWEGALIDALLSHPATRLLRTLELRLTDYHHSAERAAVALARRRRPRLEALRFGHDFDVLFELHPTSAGNRVEPETYLHAAVVSEEAGNALWEALPALRTLGLEGAFLFCDVRHDALTHLRIRGAVFADGSLFTASTPALESLTVEIDVDVHGVAASNAVLGHLDPSWHPRLRSLDLSQAYFEPEEAGDFVVLADSPILPQLAELDLRELVIEDAIDGREPPAVLAELAPRFAHLDLYVRGDIIVEGADDGEVDRVLSALAHGSD
ncbi:hypothetical protein [Streptomyces yaizuensis]|uniref:Uncharacterized protein n=1 Tax=Streptomyces yaizuensis TaxID=2989713 RepID=A0ABQ5PAJ0_9ACTN|nr:hypothetical protein [Streptomyces sp. YSPA8]GLF99609.1 hypothetical protein SYYSPA8_34950 [Streptomyces sp. YSPA8]